MTAKRTKYEQFEEDLFGQDDPSAETAEDLTGVTASSLRSAVVWSTDWTAATIVDQLKRETIHLDPAFQRRDAWTDERKSRFIESLILGLPIPQLVLAEKKRTKGKFIVIDGKQRLLSLSKFTGVGLDSDQQPLVLTGLTIRKDLNKASYATLKKDARQFSAFENQAIRTVVIRGWNSEEVLYTIFHRLNTGSLPLSAQELRQALHPGPFLTFAAKFSEDSPAIKAVLDLSKPDFRMRDVELVVRFFAFQLGLPQYRGNLKKFLDDTCDDLNKSWKPAQSRYKRVADDLEDSVQAAIKIFGIQQVFRKWDETQFEERLNRAVFDVIAYSLADAGTRRAALGHKDEVLEAFKKLCLDTEFRAAIESTTKSKKAVRDRFSKWYCALGEAIGQNLHVPLPQ
jgi:hypothetical protein